MLEYVNPQQCTTPPCATNGIAHLSDRIRLLNANNIVKNELLRDNLCLTNEAVEVNPPYHYA